MTLRYWRFRLRLAGFVHRQGSTGHEWRCRLAEALHGSYRHGLSDLPRWTIGVGMNSRLHETHVCRDCRAEITLPYVTGHEEDPAGLEGYWEKAYWEMVPRLLVALDKTVRERDLAVAHDRQPYPTAWAYEKACAARESWQHRAIEAEARGFTRATTS